VSVKCVSESVEGVFGALVATSYVEEIEFPRVVNFNSFHCCIPRGIKL